ncbi:MAG: type II secretion system protein GspD [Armatimonadetes bacterium]|nr:type II secretion system protein GspD [Armatimonadota bacterium]
MPACPRASRRAASPLRWFALVALVLVLAGAAIAQPGDFPLPGGPGGLPVPAPAGERDRPDGGGAPPPGGRPGGRFPGGRGPAGPAGAPAGPGPSAERRLEITVGPDGVSLFAVAADAHEVFTQLGEKASLRIIIDDTVNRKITVRLSNRKPKEVVDSIAAAYGLAASEVSGIFMISEGIPRNPSSYLLSDIDSIRTQYVLATTAKSLLPVFLQDYVKVNQQQNAVVLSAPAEVLKKFREDVQQFDIPAAQIMIDVLMVELTTSDAREWALQFTEDAGHHRVRFEPGAGQVSFGGVAARLPYDFHLRLRALVEKGEARVRANPRIVTVSGQQAEIFMGKQRYISTPVDAPRGGGYSGQINYIDAGVRLAMTPYTGGEGEIIADLEPEVSTMSAPDPKTGLPEKSTRRAQTSVRVRDGETIIIGGLRQREQMATRSKTPLLGDIPLLGGLFRGTHSQSVDTEMLVFITPRILSQTGHLPEAEERAIRDRMLPEEGTGGRKP